MKMKYNFDEIINRKNTMSCKWDLRKNDEILPMWVADMDFRTAEPIIDALTKRAQHGVYGYSIYTDELYNSITGWFSRRHNWTIEKSWISFSPGIVPALHAFAKIFVKPGDKILMHSPVYYPFFGAAKSNGVEFVNSNLVYTNGRYEIDFDDFEKKAKDPAVKMFYLSSPQNPGGRIWTRDELQRMGEICTNNSVIIVADEIHCDLILNGNEYTSFGTLPENIIENSIICISPSKTFNIAGLQISCIVIKNEEMKEKYDNYLKSTGFDEANVFGLEGIIAAYSEGDEWLDGLIEYLNGNLKFLCEYMRENLPQIKVMVPDATYLAWLDFKALDAEPVYLHRLLKNDGRIWLDEGYLFGNSGEGFERINIACPREVLKEGLVRIKNCLVNNSLI